MQIDIYLGFTSCQGNCIFCRKGNGLVHFPRSSSDSNLGGYSFHHFHSEKEAWEWIEFSYKKMSGKIGRINISGNEPIEWSGLENFLKILTQYQPDAQYTLRLSNTVECTNMNILLYFQRVELSLYADSENLHNQIVGHKNAWNIFHKNLLLMNETHLKRSLFFQTIPIRENLVNLPGIIEYTRNTLMIDTPIKIIYPYFFPEINIKKSLISRKNIIEILLKGVPKDVLKKYCILQNFPSGMSYITYFHSVQK